MLNFRRSNSYFLGDINPVIRFLIVSDTVITGGTGLLVPIFALFIEDKIFGGDPAVIGLAAAIYLFTKSLLQIPIAHLIDRIKGESDDYWILVVFTLVIAVMPLLYLMIDTPMQLYAVQFVLGLATAFTFPTYMALFTRHIDKDKEGTEWGVYFTLTDITGAAFAAIGGYVAATQGFPTLIIGVVVISVIGSLMLLPIRNYIYKS
jgi:MFS family permease